MSTSKLYQTIAEYRAKAIDMQGEIDSLSKNLSVCNKACVEQERTIAYLTHAADQRIAVSAAIDATTMAEQSNQIRDLVEDLKCVSTLLAKSRENTEASDKKVNLLSVKVQAFADNINFKDGYINKLIRESDAQCVQITELSAEVNRLDEVLHKQNKELSILEIELGYRNTELTSAMKELARLRILETDMEKITDAFTVIGSLLK